MTNNMPSRSVLMKKIMETNFACIDLNLFLDTHPYDTRALELFQEMSKKLKRLTALYEENYGPITATGVRGGRWSWLDSPWPWELEKGAR